ncbi:hypothetical protein TTHERM_000430109 (macronuclear) [Tetrahymena thermophila SB210]|uniref:Uncharacterized protein n=1 Tax=Tetrahymena thermophila (strain SB210) TaxID=312017 RepID=W7X0G7_TETTS|nr:hypothetical protein TTHERM_000430109 [Tetrahymena thermophila SB210]EWS72620.1 hypothetical protein TTHERM_000430109 [Tetrahymena thermophila SB210]|eukprot:XP_012654903.1 hypothetical protein TTHERM_000430109 [Tetrahymena thermophila SB210]
MLRLQILQNINERKKITHQSSFTKFLNHTIQLLVEKIIKKQQIQLRKKQMIYQSFKYCQLGQQY